MRELEASCAEMGHGLNFEIVSMASELLSNLGLHGKKCRLRPRQWPCLAKEPLCRQWHDLILSAMDIQPLVAPYASRGITLVHVVQAPKTLGRFGGYCSSLGAVAFVLPAGFQTAGLGRGRHVPSGPPGGRGGCCQEGGEGVRDGDRDQCETPWGSYKVC